MSKRTFDSITPAETRQIWKIVFGYEYPERHIIYKLEACEEEPKRYLLMSGYERLGIRSNFVVWADSDFSPHDFNQDLVTQWFVENGFI